MEDPVKEVEGVVRGLVDKPTLRQQAETLQKYCTPNVALHHMYASTNLGLHALIAIYQIALIIGNYSGVDFHNIAYDEGTNSVSVRMTVYLRPWWLLWRTIPLRLFTLLQLEDVIVNGKTVKKIQAQWDYFYRSPLLEMIPGVGEIYDSETLRFVVGNAQALVAGFFLWLLTYLFHPKLWDGWLQGFDAAAVHGPKQYA